MDDFTDRQYDFCGYRLDTRSRELLGPDGACIPLTSRALEVLTHLIGHRGQVVSKDQLLAAAWPRRVVEENNLTQAVSALRKAFGGNARDHRFIITVPGRGYCFVAKVHERGQDSTSPRPRVAAAARRGHEIGLSPGAWRRVAAVGAALVFALVLAAATTWPRHDPSAAVSGPNSNGEADCRPGRSGGATAVPGDGTGPGP